MQFNVSLPFDHIHQPDEFITMEAVAEIGGTLDRLGFYSGCVTDHPVPSARWLDNGGHYAQDPFVMLSLLAAHTSKLRLQTGIVVLPYRNPFITARMVATLDTFSKGRVVLGFGAGYLKAEYKALGVDFEQRNELMDEYLLAMKAAWTGEDFAFKGSHFEALGNRMRPAPVQRPHPPLLIGGNSKRAIRRAVELGDAWNPFFTSAAVSSTARTATMANELDLAEGLAYMRAHAEKVGKAAPMLISGSVTHPGEAWEPQKLIDKVGQMRELGAVGVGAHFDGATRREWIANAERFAAEILPKV